MAPKLKPPFNPESIQYSTKPTFLSQLQQLLHVCENDYGATQTGQQACEIQCGVSVEYQVIVGQSDTQVRRVRTQSPPPGRVINFHLVVSYNQRLDGVSAVHIQLSDENLRSNLSPMEEAVKSLLLGLQRPTAGSPSAPTIRMNARNVQREISQSSLIDLTAESFTDSSPRASIGSPAYARMAGNQAAHNLDLLDQMRSACEIAGAVLADPQAVNSHISDDCESKPILGCYAGTPFRVSIHGITNTVNNPDEFYAVWEQPRNARQMSLPGIRFLVDVLDATVASNKYLRILQQMRAAHMFSSGEASSV
jgi:hypothetical protein